MLGGTIRGTDQMTVRSAKPGRKPVPLSRPKLKSSPAGRREAEPPEPQRPRPPSRSLAMRLAAEVDALSSKLAASQARIDELEARVDIDPLTDILNRRGFERELTRSLAYVKRYGASVALVFIDLDHFKPVNDRHGHAAGDAMLKAVAVALTGKVRASDVVARIGGDEFAVILWNLSPEDAAAKARALEAAIYATPLRWNDTTLVVGASAGVAPFGPLDTPAEMMAAADAAMYARKAERNNIKR
jgi:diguanylate cyclase (GGDEF)-like protein